MSDHGTHEETEREGQSQLSFNFNDIQWRVSSVVYSYKMLMPFFTFALMMTEAFSWNMCSDLKVVLEK